MKFLMSKERPQMTEKDHKCTKGKILIVTEEGDIREYSYQKDGETYQFTPMHVFDTFQGDTNLLNALFHRKQDRDPIERLLIPALPQLLGDTEHRWTADEIQWTRDELARIKDDKVLKDEDEDVNIYL